MIENGSATVVRYLCYNLLMNRTDKAFVLMSLLALIFLVTVVNLTTPSEIGPLGVLVFFTLVYLTCLGVTVILSKGFLMLMQKTRRGRMQANLGKSYYYGSVLAFVPMILIFMRSFGELNLLEVALAVLFAIVGCFYISKRA